MSSTYRPPFIYPDAYGYDQGDHQISRGQLDTNGAWDYRRNDYELSNWGNLIHTSSSQGMLDNHYASTSVWTTDIERSGEAGGQIVDGEQELIYDYREVDVYSQGDAYANHKRKSVAVDADGDTHTLQDAFLSEEHYINSTGRVDGTSAESREWGEASASSNGGELVALEPYNNPKTGDAGFANVYGTVGYEIGSIGEADPEWGRVEDDRDWLSVSAYFSAGVADTLSLGLTYLARQQNNKLIGAMYGVETQDLTNYKSTAYWAGQWTGELIGNAAGIGAAAGALKAGAKYVGRHGLTNTAKNVGRGVVKKTTHFVDDVVLNKSNKQCGFFKRLVGKGCFVAGTQVHIESLPDTYLGEFKTIDIGDFGNDESQVNMAQPLAIQVLSRKTHLVAIQDVPLGASITAKNPDGTGIDFALGSELNWIRIVMTIPRTNGTMVQIETLRRKSEFGHLCKGDVVEVNGSEKGLSGVGYVLSVDDNFSFARGEGNPVMSRFATTGLESLTRVHFASGEKIEGTMEHPIWSESKKAFVPISSLEKGDRVNSLSLSITETVCEVETVLKPQTVYNIEVGGEHVYRIGRNGVLVHNGQYEDLKNAADDALAAGQEKGVVTQFDIPGQKPIIDFSGNKTGLHPELDKALSMTSLDAQDLKHFGMCGEIGCIDQALKAGIDPFGGKVRSINIGISGKGHGTYREPCEACKQVLRYFGMSY